MMYRSRGQSCPPLHVQHAVLHVADAVEDIEMLFYHVEAVEEVNFTLLCSSTRSLLCISESLRETLLYLAI